MFILHIKRVNIITIVKMKEIQESKMVIATMNLIIAPWKEKVIMTVV